MVVRRRPRLWPAGAALVLAAAVLVGACGLAAADELPAPTRPALSIKVDDGTMRTRTKQVHTYTVRLRNLGSADLNGMGLTETLPSGVALVSATDGGAADGGRVAWTVDLPAGQELIRTVQARVDKLPPGPGVASTACAHLAGTTVPVVCSTDLNQIPSDAELADAAGLPKATLYGVIAAGLAAVGGAVWWFLRRRRKSLAADTPAP